MHEPRIGISAHAAERWSRAVLAVLESPSDPRTLDAWSRIAGAATSTLRTWCIAAHCKPKASLDLARVLRAVQIANREGEWDPTNLLDVTDSRTLARLLVRAGVSPEQGTRRMTMTDVLAAHKFDVHPRATQELVSLVVGAGSNHWSLESPGRPRTAPGGAHGGPSVEPVSTRTRPWRQNVV
jgi:hypothetical protein